MNSPYVLLVDDDPIQHELISALIASRCRVRIETALNGIEAAAIVQRAACTPCFIVCDVHMPDRDGIEFMSFLHSRHIRSPLLILSSARPAIVRSAELLAGVKHLRVVGVMNKPVDLEQLWAAMMPFVPAGVE